MRIEAVTVCYNYADFLAETIPFNLPQLDRWIVVTAADDHATREICRKYAVEVILSNEVYRDDGFSKGRMIETGLRQLSADCWHLHMDADIILPNYSRRLLDAAWLDENKVYGCDRLMIHSYDEWQKLKQSGWLTTHHSWHCCINFPKGFTVGTRWVDLTTGYVPIGFFQLAHCNSLLHNGVRIRAYPFLHNNAARTDVQYALKWDRRNREHLPELVVVHLESEQAKLGANWNGRTTAPFGPNGPVVLSMNLTGTPVTCEKSTGKHRPVS